MANNWTNEVLPNPCGGDLNTFLAGWCCFPLLPCANAAHLGQSGPAFTILACWCNPLAVFLLRRETRRQYGIAGSELEDAVS